MVIRLGPEDICHILQYVWEGYGGKRFLSDPVNIPYLAQSWKRLMECGSAVAYANFLDSKPSGVLLGLISEDLHTGNLQGVEYLWAGRNVLSLLETFEQDCRVRKCTRIICGLSEAIGPRAAALRRLYKMRGYVPATESFSKQL